MIDQALKKEAILLIEKLYTPHYFSDSVMTARTQHDEDVIDIYRKERKQAAQLLLKLIEKS